MAKKILVIDDSETALEIIKDDLEDGGFVVSVARSSEEAEGIIFSENKPDIILLDIMMPGVEGDAFCRSLKGKPDTKDIPVIFVSTKEENELKEIVKQAGADGYLRKAFVSAGSLARIIEKI